MTLLDGGVLSIYSIPVGSREAVLWKNVTMIAGDSDSVSATQIRTDFLKINNTVLVLVYAESANMEV